MSVPVYSVTTPVLSLTKSWVQFLRGVASGVKGCQVKDRQASLTPRKILAPYSAVRGCGGGAAAPQPLTGIHFLNQ